MYVCVCVCVCVQDLALNNPCSLFRSLKVFWPSQLEFRIH